MPSRRPDTGVAYIVRHGKAGDRNKWAAPDEWRPLTPAGVRQANGIATLLRGERVGPVLSSPSARCVQTVEPLARALRTRVELHDALAEGAGPHGALRLAKRLAREHVVLCTHGDVVYELLTLVKGRDITRLAKGSTWVIEFEGSRPVRTSYLPPQA